jgi:colicin import membrane protein
MKFLILAPLLVALAGLAGAQTSASHGQPQPSLDTQRAAITAERSRLEAGFAQEDAACYQKFAVNNCLDTVNAKRRQAMAQLRQQEISLNDEERKSRGQEQLRRIKEKSSPEKLQEAQARRAKATQDYQSRLADDKNQQQGRADALANEKAGRDAHAQKLAANQKKAQARADKQAAAAQEAKAFHEREKEAQARRARHEADQLKRTKPAAKPLPLPRPPA